MEINLLALSDAFQKIGEKFLSFVGEIGIAEVVGIFFVFLTVYYVSKTLKENDATKLMVFYWVGTLFFVLLKYLYPELFDTKFCLYGFLILTAFMLILFNVEVKKSLWDEHNDYEEKSEIAHQGQLAVLPQEAVEGYIGDIIKALQNMSKDNVGALIVLSKGNLPKQVLQSGVRIDADITTQLIESVFFPKAPLHDGAMVIHGHKIQAAGCFLPLTQKTTYPKEFGTRHRAGIGITEVANVMSIVVSEETGIISIIKQGVVTRYADYDMLYNALKDYYWDKLPVDKKRRNV